MTRRSTAFCAGRSKKSRKRLAVQPLRLRRCVSRAFLKVQIEVRRASHSFIPRVQIGILRWTLKEIAQAVGCPASTLKALRVKGVLKGADRSETCEPFIYTPR